MAEGTPQFATADRPTPIRSGVEVKEASPEYPMEVVATSSSPRRIEAIKIAFQIDNVTITDGGDEDESQDERVIAIGKLRKGRGFVEESLWQAQENSGERGKVKRVYIAGDVRNGPFRKNEYGIGDTQSIAKPKALDEVKEVFFSMLDAATAPDENHSTPYYALRAGSGVLIDEPDQDTYLNSRYHTTTIMLNPMMIDHLSTDAGFEKYLAECEKLHTSDLYEEVGKKKKPEGESMLLHIAGGIELGVLVRMGVVTEIDDVKTSDPQFREKLNETLYFALVGISPKVLDSVDPQASARLKNWDWMNKMTDYAIEGTKPPQLLEETQEQAIA